jgi:hypothetical protein
VNPNAEKLGDFFRCRIICRQNFFEKLGTTLSIRYEEVDRMQINEAVLMFGHPSTVNPDATGYKKVFLTPQVSYTFSNFTIYANTDLRFTNTLYRSALYPGWFLNTQQTVGLSYRFFTRRTPKDVKASGKYYCPMHPEIVSDSFGTCPKCGMDLKKTKITFFVFSNVIT